MSDTPTNLSGSIVYLPHGGGPLPLLGDPQHAGLVAFLRELGAGLAPPSAIVVISAHWEARRPTLTGAAAPALIYDYYGFPPEAYHVEYAVPGEPRLAARLAEMLEAGGLQAEVDGQRGFDHGLFVPLKLMYPDAGIPCVQLSLVNGLDPAVHLAIGRALSNLRRENLLVLGSGLSFHSLPAFFSRDPEAGEKSEAFGEWLIETCAGDALTPAEREQRLLAWADAPHARFCHPREEHLIPLHVCFGMAAAETPVARVIYDERLMGQRVCGLLW